MQAFVGAGSASTRAGVLIPDQQNPPSPAHISDVQVKVR